MKSASILTRITLNLKINLKRTATFAVLNLPIYECALALHLFSFPSFLSTMMINCFQQRSFAHFVKFIPRYMMFLGDYDRQILKILLKSNKTWGKCFAIYKTLHNFKIFFLTHTSEHIILKSQAPHS